MKRNLYEGNVKLPDYIKEKIRMIKEEFMIKLSPADEIKLLSAKTEIECDNIQCSIINKYWN